MDDNPFAKFATGVPGTIADDNPFARFAPSTSEQQFSPNLPSSPAPSPPSAVPTPGDDGRSFDLRRPQAPNPDQSWESWISDKVEGPQDPNYAGVPSIYSQFPKALKNPMGAAATLGASDDQLADIVEKHLSQPQGVADLVAPRFIRREKDANGYTVIVTRGPDGKEQKGYLNRPGLDSEDITRGVRGALPWAAVGEALGPALAGLPFMRRMFSLAGIGGGLSAAGDLAQQPLGSQQPVEWPKAAAMGVTGPVAEAVGSGVAAIANPLYQRFIAIPKYFDKQAGQLTPLGRSTAQQMGVDPDQLTAEAAKTFGRTYAASPADAKAAVDAGTFDFNIPATKGQIAQDPQQLMQEKAMRSGIYGVDAKNQIDELDARQQAAISDAATLTLPSRFAGRPTVGGQNPNVYGDTIGTNLADARTNAKAAERAAWDAAPDISPLPGATDMLPATIGKRLSGLSVFDEVSTPTAYRMGEQLDSFMKGNAPTTKLDATLGIQRPQTVDAMRKQLSQIRGDAQTPSDQAAASAIYHGFNDWIDHAADANLLSGDAVAAANLRAARDVSAQINQIFRPSQGGTLTPGGKLLQSIGKSADTPERIVAALIPAPNEQIRPGTIEALNLIKRGLQKYGNPGASDQVWNSIKMAYLSKLTQGRNGEILSAGVMNQNIRKALNGQTSLVNAIFTPADRTVLYRFIGQLNKVTWKDPNPSGTATGVAVLAKQLFGTLLDATGPIGRAAWEFTGAQHAWGSSVARRATAQSVPKIVPPAVRTNAGRVAMPLAQPFAEREDRRQTPR